MHEILLYSKGILIDGSIAQLTRAQRGIQMPDSDGNRAVADSAGAFGSFGRFSSMAAVIHSVSRGRDIDGLTAGAGARFGFLSINSSFYESNHARSLVLQSPKALVTGPSPKPSANLAGKTISASAAATTTIGLQFH